MTASQYLISATKKLSSQSIGTARLDTLILMEYVLSIDRAKILSEPDMLISTQQKNVLNKLVGKRALHIPIAQIIHLSEFYGRQFFVNKWVLEPRPETESMIDEYLTIRETDKALKARVSKGQLVKVADIGTGSGAIGITVKHEDDSCLVDLIDIDQKALEVAKRNVVMHTIDAKLLLADLLDGSHEEYDILLCNLPYVPDDFAINLAASHEPKNAIYGGPDGLDIYRKLFKLVISTQHNPLYILCEALPPSHRELSAIAKHSGYKLSRTNDFITVYKNQD